MWTNILKFGGTALQFISPYMLYIKAGALAIIIGLASAHAWNDRQRNKDLKEVREEIGKLEQINVQTLESLMMNEKTLTECLDANAWNALQARNHEVTAAVAVANIKHLKELNTRNMEAISHAEEALRNRDKVCRTADEPLPDWLLPDSLWHD